MEETQEIKQVPHVVHFLQKMTTETCGQLRNLCAVSVFLRKASELIVHMSSTGGSLHEGFGLYHFFKALPVKVTMVNTGSVESAGVIAFLGGHHRVCCPTARFVFHPWHWGFAQPATVYVPQLREILQSLEADMGRFEALIAKATEGAKKPFKVRSTFEVAKIVGDKEALDHGFAHEIQEAKTPHGSVVLWVS